MTNDNLLLISVKPEYAIKILRGEKTVELRKSAPRKVNKNDLLLMYVTSPVMELWGVIKIENIFEDTPDGLWKSLGSKTGLTRQQYSQYYACNGVAFGIEVQVVKNLENYGIHLKQIKSLFPDFNPPQTYAYISKNKLTFKSLRSLIS